MRRRHPITIPAAPARAMLLGLFVLALAPIAAAQTPQPTPPQAPPPAQQAQPAAAKPAPAAPQAAPSPRPGTAFRGPGRRRSYASCNRQSQARGLRGGVRRRFLIRCRLGYERPRAAPPASAQNPPARQP
jgi:hypothetical protein